MLVFMVTNCLSRSLLPSWRTIHCTVSCL